MNNGYAKLDIWRLEESGSWEVERVSEHARGWEENEGIAAKADRGEGSMEGLLW